MSEAHRARAESGTALAWQDDQSFAVGETTFSILPEDGFWGGKPLKVAKADFLVAKPRWLIEHYERLVEKLRPSYIFELGIFQGGSTALLAELARPRRLVAIDRLPGEKEAVERYAADRGLADVVHTYGGIDQGDRAAIAEIADTEFGEQTIDLVVDDCSHLYEETRASFNELFPRLRPGGVFLIEDWPWAHTPRGVEPLEGLFPDQVPLTRLAFELILAIPSLPGVIVDVSVDLGAITVTRGEATIEAGDFDIADCSNPRGRALLAPAQGDMAG